MFPCCIAAGCSPGTRTTNAGLVCVCPALPVPTGTLASFSLFSLSFFSFSLSPPVRRDRETSGGGFCTFFCCYFLSPGGFASSPLLSSSFFSPLFFKAALLFYSFSVLRLSIRTREDYEDFIEIWMYISRGMERVNGCLREQCL